MAADADAAYEEHRRRMEDNTARIYMDRRKKGALFSKFKTGGKGYCLKKSILLAKLNGNGGKLAKYLQRIAGRDLRPELEADIGGKLSVGQFVDLLDYRPPAKTPTPIEAVQAAAAAASAAESAAAAGTLNLTVTARSGD